ncbi:hypothetical protein Gotri_000081 [Gossypium trilobum]|uniref:CCHC-type domain-containing protein n=1 Tax=Gossypium trilobum TaxID=34281 RepID=A0A7J9FWB9_9ROSI|nr:hypothetical protein [Gossypium trilobum]
MTNLVDLLIGQKIGTPIKEHMLKLMGLFAKEKDNWVELDVHTQIEINGGKPVQKKPEVNLVVGPSSSKGKQKAKGKKKLTKSLVPPHGDRKKAKKSKDPKKIKCFFCNKKGHFRSNCKKYLDYLA